LAVQKSEPMTNDLFDMTALRRNRQRARNNPAPAMFLQERAADQVSERLAEVNRRFTRPAIVTAFPDIWAECLPNATIVAESDTLDLTAGAHDLILHAFSLHWSNDPVGQLIQCQRALTPDGLFLGVLFGGRTLHELRATLAEAESQVLGGLSPRVAPMAELRDLGGLLQRAGFALPVADCDSVTVTYQTLTNLMRDLRAMGEANVMRQRQKTPSQRRLFSVASDIYKASFSNDSGLLCATFETIFLTGWAPAPSQQQPLRPGSATTRLADALGVTEGSPGNSHPKRDDDT
jgi:SAM-dependent methyltransferase